MSFSGEDTNQQINESMSAMVMLNSSCQAIIEAEITEVDSSWYTEMDQELGAAEELVVQWRQNGFLYFKDQINGEIISYGNTFLAAKTNIDALIDELSNDFTDATKAKAVDALTALQPPIQTMISQMDDYQVKLKAFETNMQTPHDAMNATIGKVQAQEGQIQAQITSINNQIQQLSDQITKDRAAIVKAKKARTTGIIETIFGVIFAPFTGGASLILAGIGVSSIVGAETEISEMQSQITSYQGTIASDQTDLTNDQKTIATLNAVSMSLNLAITDVTNITNALDSLRITWSALDNEMGDEITKLNDATTADQAVLVKVWYQSASNEWDIIVNNVTENNGYSVSTTNVQIG